MSTKTLLAILLAASACTPCAEQRNIALHRAATASSAIDYNLTAQLATDGIVEDKEPASMRFYLNGEPVPREEADWLLDERDKSKFTMELNSFELELKCNACSISTDAMCYYATFLCKNTISYAPYRYVMLSTSDGRRWDEIGRWEGTLSSAEVDAGGGVINLEASVPPGEYRGFKLLASCPTASSFTFNEWKFFRDGRQIEVRPSSVFSSYWVSGSGRDEWLDVDLGAVSRLSSMRLHWHNPPVSGRVMLSSDGSSWKQTALLDSSSFIGLKGRARYVRLLLDRTADLEPFSLSEIEISGSNGMAARQSDWMLVRAGEADNPEAWMPATVPGTVLTSYLDNGAIPDPFYGDNNTQISESYFLNDFIYRGTMECRPAPGRRTWLVFDGINWKADVNFNGILLGSIEGAFTDARFDVTDIVRDGGNDIEVYIHRPDHPGSNKADTYARCARNGGKLGADNPTFHATVGWDWMPSVHDRDIGIWNDVYFRQSGDITVEDPVIRTVLNPDGSAGVLLGATLVNHSDIDLEAVWKADLEGMAVSECAMVPAGSCSELQRTVRVDNPRLWWPNGYGSQELYKVCMAAVSEDGKVSDSISFNAGLRQVTYDTADGRLGIYVNGRRFIARGGNWGFSEALLRYREREYDIAVGLEAGENFNIIRNWVGQVGDEEFYEACDRYGVMVWQDFWLANPVDGPEPDDEAMFMANAGNYLRRIRNHPCIVLYCGRNEGDPPASLDRGLRELSGRLAPDIFYISDSSRGLVSGHGPYNRRSALQTFTSWGQGKFHSELGMPNVPNYESLVRFIPKEHLWPQDDIWGYHNYTMESAQKIQTFNSAVEHMFGSPKDARQFCEWAQWVNYDGYRAIFESRSAERRGLTLWMSHSAWPDLVFCTYDYYFDTDAAYYGCRKACEPIHIMWNPATRCVEVVNSSAGSLEGLRAEARVLDMYGRELSSTRIILDSREDSTVGCFGLDRPEGHDVWYYSLSLYDADRLLSENFYVQGRETDNFKSLHNLPAAKVRASMEADRLTLTNLSDTPAMMVRITARDRKTGEQILPAVISDNYFHLMPGASKTVTVRSWDGKADIKPEITGFNM